MKTIKLTGKSFQKLCCRNLVRGRRIVKTVQKIIEDVRLHGDEAVIKYTKRFDKVKLSPKDLRVTAGEINGAYQNIDTDFITSLKGIINNIEKFYFY